GRRGVERQPGPLRRREAAGEQADRGTLDIAFDPRHLAGEAQARHGQEFEPGAEQLRAVEEGIAVESAEPRELGAGQSRDPAEDAQLLAVLELGLEADDVVEAAERVVLAQL